MAIAGAAIVLITFYAIIKNYETRLVLMLSGLVMAFIGGNMSASLDGFAVGLINKSLTPIICVTMGFSAVLDYTGCSQHLVATITKMLNRVKFIMIPATVILVWSINIALLSASGLAAAVGAILIPTLIKMGIKPAMAASAVLLGTWGSTMSPGNPFLLQVADIAHEDAMLILQRIAVPSIIAVVTAALLLYVIAKLRKEAGNLATTEEAAAESAEEEFRIKPLWAVIPVVPVLILILASPAVRVLPEISITNAMLLGTALCLAVTRPNVKDFVNEFFKGNGRGFASIVCLIAAANMFVAGMTIIGLTGTLISAMENSAALAKVSAAYGPFLLAAVSGSGNAAVLAFNGAVTPYAASFGLDPGNMGAVVQSAGNIGRCMSPVAGVTIICARMAGVNPMDLAKRNAIPTIVAAAILMVMMLF